jgi:glycosyltransferase involved in cell wall biosynthesis
VKVNFVVQAYGTEVIGGAETACRRLARGVAPKAEVTVLTTCAQESATWSNFYRPGEEMEDGVRLVRSPTAAPRAPGFERLSQRVFREPDPARRLQKKWFDAQGPYAPALLEEIKRRADEPDLWIFYTYLYYPTVFGLPIVGPRAVLHPFLHDEPPARLGLVREAIRSAAAISLHSFEEWELTLRFAGWPSAKVRLIGLGVEEGSGDVESFRAKFDLGSDPYLLYLGRVDRGKGTDELASMFSGFKSKNPGPLKLVIAGPVRHHPPKSGDVVVTGGLSEEEKWGALEGCTVFVHPSPLESFGISLLEAWTKEKPALVNGRCAVTSGHARRAQAGLWYSDVHEFEAALEVLLNDSPDAHSLGENGRAYAKQFLGDRVIARYLDFLYEVAESVRHR